MFGTRELREIIGNKENGLGYELEGNYIRSQFVEVNKRGLLDAIKWYEGSWVGKFKYSFYSYNENYAVNIVIFAAGGPSNVGQR